MKMQNLTMQELWVTVKRRNVRGSLDMSKCFY